MGTEKGANISNVNKIFSTKEERIRKKGSGKVGKRSSELMVEVCRSDVALSLFSKIQSCRAVENSRTSALSRKIQG